MYSENESLIPIQGTSRPRYTRRYPLYKLQGDKNHDIRRTIAYMYESLSGKKMETPDNLE